MDYYAQGSLVAAVVVPQHGNGDQHDQEQRQSGQDQRGRRDHHAAAPGRGGAGAPLVPRGWQVKQALLT